MHFKRVISLCIIGAKGAKHNKHEMNELSMKKTLFSTVVVWHDKIIFLVDEIFYYMVRTDLIKITSYLPDMHLNNISAHI